MTAPKLRLVPTLGARLGEVYRTPGPLVIEIDDTVIYLSTTTFRGGPTWRGFRLACLSTIGHELNPVSRAEWAAIAEARLSRARPWAAPRSAS